MSKNLLDSKDRSLLGTKSMTSHGSSEPIIDHLWGLPGLPRQKMDLSHLPENERNYMMKLIEEKQVSLFSIKLIFDLYFVQAKQFMNLYNTIVSKCFEGCVTDFTSDTPSAAEVSPN